LLLSLGTWASVMFGEVMAGEEALSLRLWWG
jgi:hypothetical protein